MNGRARAAIGIVGALAAVGIGGLALLRGGRRRLQGGRPVSDAAEHRVEGPEPARLDAPASPRPTPREYRLRRRESPAAGVVRIALGRIEHAEDQLRGAEPGDRAEAVHEARKDLKKLRAVLRLVRDELGGGAYRSENERYRDAGRALSAMRDAQVAVESLDSLREPAGHHAESDGLGRFKARLEERRREAESAGADDAAIDAALGALDAGRSQIEEWRLPDGWSLVGPGLERSYRRGRVALRAALTEPTDDRLHEWRKRAKDLWYHLRILQDAWPAVLGQAAEEAHRLSELLGDDHDLAVLRGMAEQDGEVEDPGEREELLDLIERRRAQLRQEAAELGRRLYAEKPKAFAARFRGYWQVWRSVV